MLRIATSVTAAALMVLATAAPASAQDYDSVAAPLAQYSADPNLGRGLIDTVRFFQGIGPQYQFPMVNVMGSKFPGPAPELDFAQPRLAGRVAEPHWGTERLYIESPAMRRVVEIQVLRPKDRARPAPMLYLLDGVGSATESGWLKETNARAEMAREHVTVIMPTGAHGSNFADWIARDPALGHLKWETFLTQELPGVLESAAAGLNFDGNRYIGGVSMGGTAAARMANHHPEMFAGMFSISGCYSSTTPAGRAYVNMAARSMGGNPDLMWGPGLNSPERLRNDVLVHPEGIASMPVYIFTANGNATPQDVEYNRKDGLQALAGNVALEKFTSTCTRELEETLRARGQLDASKRFYYQPYGVHSWLYFGQQLPQAWHHITGGAYTYR